MVCVFVCMFVNLYPRILFTLIFLEKVEGKEVGGGESERNINVKETHWLPPACTCPGPRGEPLIRQEPRTLSSRANPLTTEQNWLGPPPCFLKEQGSLISPRSELEI